MRRLAYAPLALVPALLGLPLAALLAYTGALCVTRVGPPLLSLVLSGARPLYALHRHLLRTFLGERIEPPPPPPRVRDTVTDRASWRAAAYAALSAPLTVLLFVCQVPVRLYALAAVAYPLWFRAVHEDGHDGIGLPGGAPLDTLPRALAVAAGGAALFAAATWLGRRLTTLVRVTARPLLGRPREDDESARMAGRIHDLEETRALAVRDAAATLRRIERDLHDGAQARLMAVAMGLTRAGAALSPGQPDGPDTEKARALVDSSLANARTALEELRDLVRGIHPPVLDNGLDAALASLAASVHAPPRVRLRTVLPPHPRPPEAVETIAYFCAAELLTNAARHASAATVEIDAELAPDSGLLTLTVRDDGTGGASPAGGTGLAGLAERVRTIDGTLTLDSPPGGPTTATVRLPVPVPVPVPEEDRCAS
ncbi:sensor histidine kinase [Streptomyces albiaxialis]|uniref:histidine kinase n=1 Tax=Streptomyces albiaxialis TaxID=329523 RepID=A0ABN2W9T9_9ACTN